MTFNLTKTLNETLVGKTVRGRQVQNVRLTVSNDEIMIYIHFSAFDFMDHIKLSLDADIPIDED